MKVWSCGKWHEMHIGQQVFVGKCGSGHTVFGEMATLKRTTQTQLVFETESGKTVKTGRDDLNHVVGKVGAQGYWVSVHIDREYIHDPVFVY